MTPATIVALLLTLATATLAVTAHHQAFESTPPALLHLTAKLHTLNAINEVRAVHGAPHLSIGNNSAAQLHAQDMLANCYTSHWDSTATPPHLRHSQHGGYQPNAENVFSDNECNFPDTNQQRTKGHREMAPESVQAFMDSPGHRDTMLDPAHTHVSIGLAHNAHTYKAVHHYHTQRATLKAPVRFGPQTLQMLVDLPPEPAPDPQLLYIGVSHQPRLSQIQVEHLRLTTCYDTGAPAAVILPPGHDPPETSVVSDLHLKCDPPSPHPGGFAPATVQELTIHHRSNTKPRHVRRTHRVVILEATTWNLTKNTLSISADHRPITQAHGPGIYNITLATTQGNIPKGHSQLLQFTALWPQQTDQPVRVKTAPKANASGPQTAK